MGVTTILCVRMRILNMMCEYPIMFSEWQIQTEALSVRMLKDGRDMETMKFISPQVSFSLSHPHHHIGFEFELFQVNMSMLKMHFIYTPTRIPWSTMLMQTVDEKHSSHICSIFFPHRHTKLLGNISVGYFFLLAKQTISIPF